MMLTRNLTTLLAAGVFCGVVGAAHAEGQDSSAQANAASPPAAQPQGPVLQGGVEDSSATHQAGTVERPLPRLAHRVGSIFHRPAKANDGDANRPAWQTWPDTNLSS